MMEHSKRNILLLGICQVFALASVMTLITFSVLVGKMLSPDPKWASLPAALTVFGAALSAIPASYFMKHFGRKRGFQLGAIAALISGIIAVYAIYDENFVLFCFAMWLHGNYQAFSAFYRFAAQEVSPPHKQKQAISYVLAGGLFAALITPTLSSEMNIQFEPVTFAGAYILIVILSLLVHVPIGLLKFPTPKEKHVEEGANPSKTSPWEMIRRPAFICAMTNAGGGYLLMSLVMTASPLAVIYCGFEAADAAIVIQWHTFAMFAPSFFTGSLIARYGSVRIIFAGMASFAIAATIALEDVALNNFYLALIFVGLGWNLMFTAGTTLLAEAHTKAENAMAQGINDFLVYSLTATAALGSGYIFDAFGWAMLNKMVYGVLAVLAMVTLWYVMTTRRAKAQL